MWTETPSYGVRTGDDAGDFKVTPSEDGMSAELTFASAPDFEDPADERAANVYKVTVTGVGRGHRRGGYHYGR